jgi:hypothetical protein
MTRYQRLMLAHTRRKQQTRCETWVLRAALCTRALARNTSGIQTRHLVCHPNMNTSEVDARQALRTCLPQLSHLAAPDLRLAEWRLQKAASSTASTSAHRYWSADQMLRNGGCGFQPLVSCCETTEVYSADVLRSDGAESDHSALHTISLNR